MKKVKALIVEDEFIIAEDIRHILIGLDYEVVGIALKYSQAITMLEKYDVDIILLDIMLGGSKTGIDLAGEINERFKIPFVFLTSHADAATVKKAKAVHPHGYLLKPFSKDDLFTTIEMVLAKNEQQNPNKTLENLSDRERDVYKALVDGNTDQEIAERLFVSLNTVKTHLKNIYKKLNVKNRLEAAALYNRLAH